MGVPLRRLAVLVAVVGGLLCAVGGAPARAGAGSGAGAAYRGSFGGVGEQAVLASRSDNEVPGADTPSSGAGRYAVGSGAAVTGADRAGAPVRHRRGGRPSTAGVAAPVRPRAPPG
jgi:hypothetical protein